MKYFLIFIVISGVICDKETHEHGHKHPGDIDGKHDSTYDHEAILGSKEEEKEFSQLEPEEAKTRLRVLATKMDKDGDGKITKEELEQWVLNSFTRMDLDEAKKRMGEYDADKDGFVTWSELRLQSFGYTEEDIKELESSDGESKNDILEMLDADKKKFNLADMDQDGKLNTSEFAMFEHPYNYEHMHDLEIQRLMDSHDKNKDGLVAYEEFKSSGDDPESEIYEKEQFEQYDKDKNGHLDRSEVKKWAIPDNEESARDEASHLLEEADNDKDGVLSIDDIVDNHELFVGSQATDYGNYLNRPSDEL